VYKLEEHSRQELAKMGITWKEAEVAAIKQIRIGVAHCIHLDAGWIKVKMKVTTCNSHIFCMIIIIIIITLTISNAP